MLHYLDNFFIVLESNLVADTYGNYFVTICRTLDLKINKEKNVYDTKIDFLNIEIDSMAMEAHLPEDKLLKAKT